MELDVHDLGPIHVVLDHQRPLAAQVIDGNHTILGTNTHMEARVIKAHGGQLLACKETRDRRQGTRGREEDSG